MKQIFKSLAASLLVTGVIFSSLPARAQGSGSASASGSAPATMKTYVIERDIPGAGAFTPEKLKDISKTSCSVLNSMGPSIQWVQSYVTGNKIFCVYRAENEELLREHAKKGGFPITNIYEVSTVISPATAQN
jgi:hypothetical protein